MRAVSSAALAPSIETDRTEIRPPEQMFGSILGDVARLLWPAKTAAHLASAAGCGERVAEMYLASYRDWSGDAVTAIMAEILRRHAIRNLRITRRS